MWKSLFRRALDPESYWRLPELEQVIEAFERAGDGAGPVRQPAALTDDGLHALLVATQPMAAALGATLHTQTGPNVFEDQAHLALLAVYANDAGVGTPEMGRYDRFAEIVAHHGMGHELVPRTSIADLSDAPEECFAAPAAILAMSRRVDRFGIDLLGIDLSLRSFGLLPPWAWAEASGAEGQWERLDLSRALGRQKQDQAGEVRRIVKDCGLDERRLRRGIELGDRLVRQWSAAVAAHIRVTTDPRVAMATLLQRRAREASVYHHRSRLEGRTLTEWFTAAREDPWPLLEALGRSAYIRAGEPEKSPLITRFLAFDGPMFRIFSPADIDVIRRWIESLARPPAELPSRPQPVVVKKLRGDEVESQGTPPSGLRSAYTRLAGRCADPATLSFARKYVDHWLGRAAASLDRHPFPLPSAVPASGDLREWLLVAHDQHAEATDLDSGAAASPSRAEIVDSTLQLAPLTLIDGSWLLGFTDVSLASGRVGHALFETYWDELGNGDLEINHPKLYREVLAAMDISLGPVGSPEFAQDPRLRERSFDLPVYWLAIGRFPLSYQPEILGLNLAMELSGVGGSYRVAQQALREHGFPTIFVDIHNTIDNVSTGHSAWAADAVDAYLTSLREVSNDSEILERHWHRIRLGYASLDPDPTRPRFFDRRALARLARTVTGFVEARPTGYDEQRHHTPMLSAPGKGRPPITSTRPTHR